MGPLDILRHPLLLAGVTIPEFLRWYFFVEPTRIMRTYVAYLRALCDIFSFLFLLRTLLSPWKQIRDSYPIKGLNFTAISEAFVLNCLSRGIGLLFRLVTIVIGTAFVLLTTVLFAFYYMAWLTFPILFWLAVTHLISSVLA